MAGFEAKANGPNVELHPEGGGRVYYLQASSPEIAQSLMKALAPYLHEEIAVPGT